MVNRLMTLPPVSDGQHLRNITHHSDVTRYSAVTDGLRDVPTPMSLPDFVSSWFMAIRWLMTVVLAALITSFGGNFLASTCNDQSLYAKPELLGFGREYQ